MFTEILETLAAYIFFVMVLVPSFIWLVVRKSWQVPYKFRDKYSKHLFESSSNVSDQENMRQNRIYAKRLNKILFSIGGVGMFLVALLYLFLLLSQGQIPPIRAL